MNSVPDKIATDSPVAFSIVVLNWNSRAHLVNCLASIRRQTCRSFELICIDNGSKDGSREWLATLDLAAHVQAPARTLFLPVNTGFAAGMNTGLRMARGTWLMPLNVDIVLAADFLEQAARHFTARPDIASIAPVVYQWDNGPTDCVATTGIWLARHLSATTDIRDTSTEREVFGPAGCCPVFTRAALEDTQLDRRCIATQEPCFYDELYFAYGEDVDLFLRLQLRGQHCLYTTAVRAWHVHSGTQAGVAWQDKSGATLRRFPANAFYTWLKCLPAAQLIRCALPVLGMPLAMSVLLLRRAPRKAWCPLVSYFAMLWHLPRTLRLRRSIQRGRRVTPAALAPFFR